MKDISTSNERMRSRRRPRLTRLDILLGSALTALVASYAMGYHLDWAASDMGLPGGVLQAAAAPVAPTVVPPASLPAPSPVAPAVVAEAQPPASVPGSEEAEWQAMTERLSSLAAGYRGHVAIYLEDFKSGRTWTYHPDDFFPAASLIKVPVMASVISRIQEGKLSLRDQLMLTRHERAGGSGSLKWQPSGTRYTIMELLEHMITESDNTATKMLIDAVGMDYLQQEFPKLGLVYTGIFPEGMSLNGSHVARENYTTAREMAMLMSKIYRGDLIDRGSSQMMLELLRRKKPVAARLAKGLPGGWEIAHKTGLLRRACHDTAIFLTPNGDYALTVLTGQNSNYHAAKNFITRLGHVTFAYYGAFPERNVSYYAAFRPRSHNFLH